uniref:Uncharacterized protein n=1 Tax=Salix viminalis TaxID=40686 RepID=A0A6N2M0Y8_SALVM
MEGISEQEFIHCDIKDVPGNNLFPLPLTLGEFRFQFFSSRIFIGEPDTQLDHGVTAVGNKVSTRNKVLVGEELVWRVMQRNVSAKEGLNVIAMRSSYTPLSDVSISQQMPPQLTLCFYHLSERENSKFINRKEEKDLTDIIYEPVSPLRVRDEDGNEMQKET